MMKIGTTIISRFLIVAFISLVGCAGPRPVLYPNNHFEQVGQERVDQDVAACEELAEEYISKSNAGEKVVGQTVVGGAIGAAVNTDNEPQYSNPHKKTYYIESQPRYNHTGSHFCPPGQAKKGRC